MKLMKRVVGITTIMLTLILTSCLEGGNSANYSQFPGTIEAGGYLGDELYFRGDDGSLISPTSKAMLEDLSHGDRVLSDIAIDYDKQPNIGGKYMVADLTNVTKLRLDGRDKIMQFTTAEDTAGIVNDPLRYISVTSIARTSSKWYFNLNLSFYKTDDHAHDFTLWEDLTRSTDENRLRFTLYHDAKGDTEKKKLTGTNISYDITTMVAKFEPGNRITLTIDYVGLDNTVSTQTVTFYIPEESTDN